LAIGLGLVFLLVLIGIVIALVSRNSEKERQYPPTAIYADQPEKGKHRPTSLLATLNAATAMITTDASRGQHKYPPNDSASLSSNHHDLTAIPVGGSMSPDGEFDDYVRTRWSFE
jgi:hypothetical protein